MPIVSRFNTDISAINGTWGADETPAPKPSNNLLVAPKTFYGRHSFTSPAPETAMDKKHKPLVTKMPVCGTKEMTEAFNEAMAALEAGAPPQVLSAHEIRMREEIAKLERDLEDSKLRFEKHHQMRIERGDFDGDEDNK